MARTPKSAFEISHHIIMIKKPEEFFAHGCGRCSLHGTQNCKTRTWSKQLHVLRQIVLSTGLTETAKWGMPVYTVNGKNVAMIAAFKDNCVLSFFKGSLLADEDNILVKSGENSEVTRLIRFTDIRKITEISDSIRTYIFEAIEIEKSGIKPRTKKPSEYHVPEEFSDQLKKNKLLKKAFESLTPGRQKAYLIYFSGAKQSATRESRIQKCIPDILAGFGFGEKKIRRSKK